MRSLKIIIFRDTDKPYTMIIPSALIVGVAFGAIALISLFTFSVMSNVMLFNNNARVIAQTEPAQDINNQQIASNDLVTEEDQPADQGNEEEVPPLPDYEDSDQKNQDQVGEDVETEAADNEAGNSELSGEAAYTVENYHPEATNIVTALNSVPVLGNNSISLRVYVTKRQERGVAAQGRFVAALLNKDGSFGKSYPDDIRFDGSTLANPTRGITFNIRYRKDYNLNFTNIRPDDYQAVVLYVYSEDGMSLLWRDVIELNQE